MQFRRNFAGQVVHASSPQGRFAPGAAELDGRTLLAATAVGKQLFLEFEQDRILRIHVGLCGAWDFAGEIDRDATLASANGRMGQTNQRGTFLEQVSGDDAFRPDALPESSLASIGAPRRP